MVTKVRHQLVVNETIHTRYGAVKVDKTGLVSNLDELTGTPEQLIQNVPGFVDGDVFAPTPPTREPVFQEEAEETPPPPLPPAEVQIDPATGAALEPPPPAPPPSAKNPEPGSDEAYWKVIDELLKAGTATNTEGYIDMKALNEELRRRGVEVITGTKRKEITDKFAPKKDANEGKSNPGGDGAGGNTTS